MKTAAGRVPVIAGAGSNSTDEAISLLQHAKSVGAHAALVVNPYYNRPTQDGVYAHYKTLNEAVQLPIFLYNVPGRTGSDMQPELIGRLAKLPNVIGIKDASADLSRVARHTALCRERFHPDFGRGPHRRRLQRPGRGGLHLRHRQRRALPVRRMQEATLQGDYAEARRINDTLARLHRAMFLEASPAPAKYALSLLGLCTDEVRLPLVPVQSADVKKEIEAAMKEAGVL